MKKAILICFLATALSTFFIPKVFAEGADAKIEKGVISVSATASENQSPDTVFVTLAVQTRAKTATDAADENRKKSENVISAVKKIIDNNPGDTVKTTSYVINPYYEYSQIIKKTELKGYNAVNEITIKTKKIDKAGSIIDTALSNGANNVNNIRFSIENSEKYYNSLLTKATKEAKSRADIIATTLGLRVSGLKMISSSCDSPVYSNYAGRGFMMKSMDAAMPEAAPTPIEAGDIKVQCSVSAEFYTDK